MKHVTKHFFLYSVPTLILNHPPPKLLYIFISLHPSNSPHLFITPTSTTPPTATQLPSIPNLYLHHPNFTPHSSITSIPTRLNTPPSSPSPQIQVALPLNHHSSTLFTTVHHSHHKLPPLSPNCVIVRDVMYYDTVCPVMVKIRSSGECNLPYLISMHFSNDVLPEC